MLTSSSSSENSTLGKNFHLYKYAAPSFLNGEILEDYEFVHLAPDLVEIREHHYFGTQEATYKRPMTLSQARIYYKRLLNSGASVEFPKEYHTSLAAPYC